MDREIISKRTEETKREFPALISSYATEKNKREELNKPNEDYLCCDERHGIFLIADGVTRPHEEYADAEKRFLAAEAARKLCFDVRDNLLKHEEELHAQPIRTISNALAFGNEAMKEVRRQYQREMGKAGIYVPCVTFLCLVLVGSRMYFYNCCDTIAFLIRNGVKIQLTEYYNRQADLLHPAKKEVYENYHNNEATEGGFAIFDGDDSLKDMIHVSWLELEKNDRLILASDGLAQYLQVTSAKRLLSGRAEEHIRNSVVYDTLPYQKYADDKSCIIIDILGEDK